MRSPALGRFVRSVMPIATIAAVSFTTRASFADHYRVPTGSMEPTVLVGDHIVVSKIAYGVRLPMSETWLVTNDGPARGDVVVIEVDEPTVLLKRVVAVAGDLVEVRDGHVFLNDVRVEEPYLAPDGDGGPDFGPVRVPTDRVLVLGDNRGNSRDGRAFGWVDRRRVLGRALAIVGRDGKPAYRPL